MANTENQLILITDVAVGKFQEMLFDADKRYQVKNPIPVAVDKTSEAQKLGELLLNKENA